MTVIVTCPNCGERHSKALYKIRHCEKCGYTDCVDCTPSPSTGICPKCGEVHYFMCTDEDFLDSIGE